MLTYRVEKIAAGWTKKEVLIPDECLIDNNITEQMHSYSRSSRGNTVASEELTQT